MPSLMPALLRIERFTLTLLLFSGDKKSKEPFTSGALGLPSVGARMAERLPSVICRDVKNWRAQ